MKINLNDPLEYTLEKEGAFKETHSENDSTYFIFNVYNKDEKDSFDLTVEVKDGKVKISHETCAKHACSRMGYISNKYESLICLPNSFIITIESNETGDTDIIS